MLNVIISYTDKDTPVDSFGILTYLRGDGYWQFLTSDGSTISVPDHAVQKVEILPSQDG